ncbi:hypothetical protein ABTL00_19740, partial [Acinetobacter baumannii]
GPHAGACHRGPAGTHGDWWPLSTGSRSGRDVPRCRWRFCPPGKRARAGAPLAGPRRAHCHWSTARYRVGVTQ